MIDRIIIENFKSLRRIDLSLGSLPGASGKSNFLDALRAGDREWGSSGFRVDEGAGGRRTKWSELPKLEQALGGRGLVEPGAFDALSGLRSLPFPKPSGSAGTSRGRVQPWRVAVKVIDPRGNEGLRVLTEDGLT